MSNTAQIHGNTPRAATLDASPGITAASFLPDDRVVLGDEDGSLTLWALGQHDERFFASSSGIWSLAVSVDGARALISAEGGSRLVNIEARAPTRFDARDERLSYVGVRDYVEVAAAVFSPDGARLLLGEPAGYTLYDAENATVIRTFDGQAGRFLKAAFSPDGSQIAASMGDDTIALFDVESGERLHSARVEGDVGAIAFADDGVLIGGNGVRLWHPGSNELGEPLGEDFARHLAISRDRRRVLVSTENGAQLWDREARRLLHTFRAPTVAAALSPDEDRVLTLLERSGQIVLWDVETGRVLQVFWTEHQRPSTSVSFSSDGRRVLAGAWNRRAFAWDTHPAFFRPPSVQVRMACDVLHPLGLIRYSDIERVRFPILASEPPDAPCPVD